MLKIPPEEVLSTTGPEFHVQPLTSSLVEEGREESVTENGF